MIRQRDVWYTLDGKYLLCSSCGDKIPLDPKEDKTFINPYCKRCNNDIKARS